MNFDLNLTALTRRDRHVLVGRGAGIGGGGAASSPDAGHADRRSVGVRRASFALRRFDQLGGSCAVARRTHPHLIGDGPSLWDPARFGGRDRAGLNGRGAAEPSYMKKRTAGHTETMISATTRADWSDAFALVPVSRWRTCGMPRSLPESSDGLLRIGFVHHQQII